MGSVFGPLFGLKLRWSGKTFDTLFALVLVGMGVACGGWLWGVLDLDDPGPYDKTLIACHAAAQDAGDAFEAYHDYLDEMWRHYEGDGADLDRARALVEQIEAHETDYVIDYETCRSPEPDREPSPQPQAPPSLVVNDGGAQ